MGEKLRRKGLKFSSIFWGITLGGVYIAAIWFSGVLKQQPAVAAFNIGIHLFFLSILRPLWYFFFAQFILPVRTNAERKKIYERLIKNSSGAALFIKDGKLIEKEGERKKNGAGVIVLDSASAVVVKKTSQYTQVSGPGVLFTDKGEIIAEAPVPLQKLQDSAGPKGNENPFAPKNEYDDTESYTAVQRRRYETSALTRDGIEIVPNIHIVFKIDADPAKEDEDGSRFGYNEDAVRKAIWHTTKDHKKNIYWNQLPINLAADLWREYLGKYRFEELFKAEQKIQQETHIQENKSEKIAPAPTPSKPHYEYGWNGILCDLLLDLNAWLSKKIEDIDKRINQPIQDEERSIERPSANQQKKDSTQTALQSIMQFMSQRLKEPVYTPLDRYGKPLTLKADKPQSPEYSFLKERGIRVLSVRVSTLRFNKELEEEMINNYSSTWLKSAKDAQAYTEKQILIRKRRGEEKALIEYTNALSKKLANENPASKEDALKILLQTTRREIIRNDAIHKKAEKEIEQLTDLLHWIDKGGKPLG